MMESDRLLKCMGNVEERYIEETDQKVGKKEKAANRRRYVWKKAVTAACLSICVLVGGGMIAVKAMGIDLTKIFMTSTKSAKEESIYELEIQIERVPEDSFSGQINEVRSDIIRQYEDYEPYMSRAPGFYEKSLDSFEELLEYVGADFPIEHPMEGKPVDGYGVVVYGNEKGEFLNLEIAADYVIDRYRVTVSGWMTCDTEEGPITARGAMAEYAEYTSEPYTTKNGIECLIIQATPNERGYVCMDGFFVKGKVLYSIHVVSKEGREEGGIALLKELLDKY